MAWRAVLCKCLILAAMATAGCNGATEQSILCGLEGECPSERSAACLAAGQRGDESALPLLVERLEDPAADVRFFAIAALRRMTGQTLGYHYYDKPEERLAAVQRWRQWLQREAVSAKEAGN
jgi:HEAT repeat protein